MKKIFILFAIFLSSCSSAKDSDIEKAKNDALNWVVDSTIETWMNSNSWILQEEIVESWDKNISYKYLTEEKFIRVDKLDLEDFSSMKKEITWITLEKVDKIDISYENIASWKKSKFTLSKFKSWDETFMFRAFKEYNTLDFWENIYVISAYSWEKISKLELKIFLEKILEEENNEEKTETSSWNTEKIEKVEIIKEPIKSSELPVWAVFWNPVEIWNWKVTYSDIKWLELEKISTDSLKNDESAVTNFLSSKYRNIFYWNTKRPISWENWVSYFVVRVEGNNYFYEKHYYNWEYYGVVSLEKWDFDSSLPLEEKTKVLSELNSSLREKNNSFPMVKISDSLFTSFKK